MGVSSVREELHQLINQADEETVNRIYELIKSDQANPLLSKEQRLDLDKRVASYRNGESLLYTWPEVRDQIENRK
jgi:hypothetical protein